MRPNIVFLTSPPLSLKRVPLDTARSTHLILDLSKVRYKPDIPSVSFLCEDRALAGEEKEKDGEKKKKKAHDQRLFRTCCNSGVTFGASIWRQYSINWWCVGTSLLAKLEAST